MFRSASLVATEAHNRLEELVTNEHVERMRNVAAQDTFTDTTDASAPNIVLGILLGLSSSTFLDLLPSCCFHVLTVVPLPTSELFVGKLYSCIDRKSAWNPTPAHGCGERVR